MNDVASYSERLWSAEQLAHLLNRNHHISINPRRIHHKLASNITSAGSKHQRSPLALPSVLFPHKCKRHSTEGSHMGPASWRFRVLVWLIIGWLSICPATRGKRRLGVAVLIITGDKPTASLPNCLILGSKQENTSNERTLMRDVTTLVPLHGYEASYANSTISISLFAQPANQAHNLLTS